MLLSSNIIHIYVRVVILVRMICTRLPAAVWVKSCPGMHSSWAIASSSKPETCLLLPKCQLVYAILTQVSVHVA